MGEKPLITEQKLMEKNFNQLIEAIIFTGNVSVKIHSLLDETEIYRVIEKEFAKSKLYSMCIFLLTEDKSNLRIAATSEFYRKNKTFERIFGSQLKQFRVDLNQSNLCSQVVREEKTLNIKITDLLQEIAPPLQDDLIKKVFGNQTKRVIMTPLYHGKKVIGIFDTCSIPLTEQYVPVVKNFARHLSAALELAEEHSERESVEETLRKSEEKYRGLFEEALDAIFVADAETGIILDCNRAALRLVGRKKSEVIGKHQRILHSPEDVVGEFTGSFLRHISKDDDEIIETKVITKTGKLKDVAIKARVSSIGGKKIIQGIFRDITDRKRMEEELFHERDLLRALMDNIPDTIYFKDANSRFIRINKAQAQMLGVKNPAEAVGKTDFDYFTPEHSQDAYNDEQDIVKTGKPVVYKVEKIRRADGQFLWVSATKVPIKDAANRVVGTVGISRDVTEHRQMEEKLRRHSEQLEELVKERTLELRNAERLAAIGETATMVGHDLRNPLQVIIGTLYLARENLNNISCPQEKKQKIEKLFTRIGQEIRYIDKIISDLRDYARPTKVELEETNISDVINETLSSLTIPDAIKVSVTISDSFPKLMVDPTLMRRVFTNLILNAIQAMPDEGQLRIGAFETGEDAFINVQDTGVGIAKENLPKLFQPLFTTKAKGQGFGLAVCKKLLELHGAEITVESEVGKGSTFTIKVPFRR